MQRLSDMLYQCGDGQQYIKSITIRDNATNGDIRTPLASISSTSLGGGSYGKTVMSGGVWHIELPGDPHPGLFAHEHGHFEWQLGEEYTASQGCPCVMANLSVGAQMQYCDSSNHNGAVFSQSPCWDTIRSKTNMEHTDGSYSGATTGPACEVTVENSGQ
ncbi:MAG: hypothetical protein E3J72_02020 [Planctomycetota bacterium]|nr:MAG: hypothetical protein E3J72_02020 [Planctomycetota bacterium]